MLAPREPSPSGPPADAAGPCECCQEIGGSSAQLVHEPSGTTVTACLRCLRSVMQMQVDVSDQRGRTRLFGSAETLGWQVWRAQRTLYLLPAVAPFVPHST